MRSRSSSTIGGAVDVPMSLSARSTKDAFYICSYRARGVNRRFSEGALRKGKGHGNHRPNFLDVWRLAFRLALRGNLRTRSQNRSTELESRHCLAEDFVRESASAKIVFGCAGDDEQRRQMFGGRMAGDGAGSVSPIA